jgi:hypothetical protein
VQYCVSGQSVFCMQATQMFVVVLQNGVVPSQSAFWAHATQAALVLPLAPRQTGVPPSQMLPELPQTQIWSRQRLLPPVHSLSARQPAAQVLSLVQYCPTGQLLSWVQVTQVLVAVLQTGVVPLQSLFCVHATQVLVWGLQTGVVPPQCPFWVQATQVLVSVLQIGVPPPQLASWVHWTQVPLPAAPEQIAVLPLHAAAPGLQTQTWLTQALLAPVHSLLARQPTAHVLLLVQYCPAGQLLSWVQATQVLVCVLQ